MTRGADRRVSQAASLQPTVYFHDAHLIGDPRMFVMTDLGPEEPPEKDLDAYRAYQARKRIAPRPPEPRSMPREITLETKR